MFSHGKGILVRQLTRNRIRIRIRIRTRVRTLIRVRTRIRKISQVSRTRPIKRTRKTRHVFTAKENHRHGSPHHGDRTRFRGQEIGITITIRVFGFRHRIRIQIRKTRHGPHSKRNRTHFHGHEVRIRIRKNQTHSHIPRGKFRHILKGDGKAESLGRQETRVRIWIRIYIQGSPSGGRRMPPGGDASRKALRFNQKK